ncbi:MAG: hypothetical protein NT005_03990 [Spirochaetes bacterium]|nr:hypothetical protein [Spirochaetota bacterium]
MEKVDGTQVVGKLIGIEENIVSVMKNDGDVESIKRSTVAGVRGKVEPPQQQAADLGLPRSYFGISPLGLVQFGPSVVFGFRIAPGFYLTPQLRLPGFGVVYYLVAQALPSATSLASFAPGLKASYFFKRSGKPNCWYVDGVVAYQFAWTDRDLYFGDIGLVCHDEELVIMMGLGYRWRTPSRLFVDFGFVAGGAATTVNVS